jgi:hypothetical protein
MRSLRATRSSPELQGRSPSPRGAATLDFLERPQELHRQTSNAARCQLNQTVFDKL